MEGRRNTAAVLVRSDVLLAQIRQQQSLNKQVSAAHNSQKNCHVEATAASAASQQPEYSYKVKIINPHKKSDTILRQLNSFSSLFTSPLDLHLKIIKDCADHVPNTVDFNVGYYDGSQQAKVLIASSDDLQTMYKKYSKGGNLTMWCDGRQPIPSNKTGTKRKNMQDSETTTLREEKESEVESTFERLSEDHGDNYDTPKLRLWSRMIVAGIHNDFENPPNIPAFNGNSAKRTRRNGLSEVLNDAAIAFVEAIKDKKGDKENQAPSAVSSFGTGSPSRAVDLRMKNYQQLRYIQSLYDDGILSDTEFAEQKALILSSIRKL